MTDPEAERCGACGRPLPAAAKGDAPACVFCGSADASRPSERIISDDQDVPVEWEPGMRLLDQYEVRGVLGQGGMGKVYRVRHLGWGVDLAVKTPRPELLDRARGLRIFERECETWVGLGLHPHVVTCFYVRRLGGIPRIFAEHVSEGSLHQWIRRKRLYEGGAQAALERIICVAAQMAWGLQFAHEHGLIHRDVKPGNILMTAAGGAKVTDFGLARARALAGAETDRPRGAKRKSGMTPLYCAPEQANRQEVSLKADMWSWAVSLLHMFWGRVAWESGPKAAQALSDLYGPAGDGAALEARPASLLEVLRWCLEENPGNRPPSMEEVASHLIRLYRDVAGAEFPFPRPLAMEPRASNLNNRAVSMVDLGRPSQAESLWKQALATDPYHLDTAFNSSLYAWRRGKATDLDVISRISEAGRESGADPALVAALAHAHLERGDVAEARALAAQTGNGVSHVWGELREAIETRSAAPCGLRGVLEGHADGINALAMGRSKRWLYSASDDNTVRQWDLASLTCARSFAGHAGSVTDLAVDREESRLFTASQDRTVRAWNLADGSSLGVWEGHDGPVLCLALSREGDRVLTASASGQAVLWSASEGALVRSFMPDDAPVYAAALSGDGGIAAAGTAGGRVVVWDTAKNEALVSLDGHAGPVYAVSMSLDGRYVFSAGHDGALRLWDARTGKALRSCRSHGGPVRSLVPLGSGERVATLSDDGSLRLWETDKARCRRTWILDGRPQGLALTRSGGHAAVGDGGGAIRVLATGLAAADYAAPLLLSRAPETESAMQAAKAYQEALGEASAHLQADRPVEAARAASRARSAPGYHTAAEAMELWRGLYRRLRRVRVQGVWKGPTLEQSSSGLRAAAIRVQGDLAAGGAADGTVWLWRTDTGEAERRIDAHGGAVEAVDFSACGRYLLTGSDDGGMCLWDVSTGAQRLAFQQSAGSVVTARLSPQGRLVASGDWDLRLWDARTGSRLRTFEGNPVDVLDVAWRPDGRYVAAATSERLIKIWDVVTGERAQVLSGHAGPVSCLRFSADGALLLSGSRNLSERPSRLRLWDARTWQPLGLLEGHEQSVASADLCAQSMLGVSGGRDKAAILWDIPGRRPIRVLRGHAERVEAVAVAPDGAFALSASADGSAQLWMIDWELAAPRDDRRAFEGWLRRFKEAHRLVRDAPPTAPPGQDPPSQAVMRALRPASAPVCEPAAVAALRERLASAGFGAVSADALSKRVQPQSVGVTLSRFWKR